jgi:hypothetical protein
MNNKKYALSFKGNHKGNGDNKENKEIKLLRNTDSL